MKFLIFFTVLLFNSCSSQLQNESFASSRQTLQFEDRYHYRYSLTAKPFLVIDTQNKMNDIFSIIHSKSGGTRLSPIPTMAEGETYLIFKPILKSSNDVEIQLIRSENEVLYIDVKPAIDPNVSKNDRISPNILIKILKSLKIKNVKVNYLIN